MTVAVTAAGISPDAPGGLEELTRAGLSLRFAPCDRRSTAAEVVEAVGDSEIVIAGGEPFTSDVFAALPNLRHIARIGVGFDSIDLESATAHGVLVTTTPGANSRSVAELTFGLLLTLARNIGRDDTAIRRGGWPNNPGVELGGKTLGILGLGNVGRAVARRAAAFDMRVLAFESEPDLDFVESSSIELSTLEIVFRESDIVSVHLPLAPETAGLVDGRLLGLMKRTAFLINTSRGGLVVEEALEHALRAGSIAGAGLDVRTEEPPSNARFLDLDNVILTPHSGGRTGGAWEAASSQAAANILRARRGERPEHLLNSEVWGARAYNAGAH